MESSKPAATVVSIGRLARETGLSPDRLRIWERRYGRPRPIRLPSGHRRYPVREITRLRWVSDLVARGERPSAMLELDMDALRELHAHATSSQVTFAERDAWMKSITSFRERDLRQRLQDCVTRMSTLELIERRITPTLIEVGARWASGDMDVRHEHFAARVFEDFLRERRHAYEPPENGTPIVLATLPEERHSLPLSMLAALGAEHGTDSILLGPDTPIEEIARTALESGSTGVAISVSLSGRGPHADRALRDLRDTLPESIELVAGGAGMAGRRGPRGVKVLADLRSFLDWSDRFTVDKAG